VVGEAVIFGREEGGSYRRGEFVGGEGRGTAIFPAAELAEEVVIAIEDLDRGDRPVVEEVRWEWGCDEREYGD